MLKEVVAYGNLIGVKSFVWVHSRELMNPEARLAYLKRVKALIAARGLGVFLKYLQKAFAVTKKQKEELSWGAFAKVANGYLALANMKTEAY